jgi:propionyl-CoA carboxylase alpha chain
MRRIVTCSGYYSAGTVELIVSGADPSGESFYFLEMNTRLAGGASGDRMHHRHRSGRTDDPRCRWRKARHDAGRYQDRRLGHRKPRLCRRSLSRILPSTGRLTRYRSPVAGWTEDEDANGRRGVEGVRVDDGVYDGGEVSMFYDPMIAKLITWGTTRDEAADLQIAALDRFEIEGLGHNIDFVSAIMQHPRFRSGELTTGFIAEEYPDGFHGAASTPDLVKSLAAIAGFVATGEADRARHVDGQLGDTLEPPARWQVKIGDAVHDIEMVDGDMHVDGDHFDLSMEYDPGDRLIEAEIGDEELAVKVSKTRTGFKLTTRGATHIARVLPGHIAHLADHMIEKIAPDLSRFLICPMPGLLTTLHVNAGDAVEAGQPLAVVEAMKMENILRAEKCGTVKIVNAKAGDSLAVDAVILEME